MLVYTASMIKCKRSKDEYRRIFKAWDAEVGALLDTSPRKSFPWPKVARAGGGPLSASIQLGNLHNRILGDF